MRPVSLKERLTRLQLFMSVCMLLIAWILIGINDFFIFRDLLLQKYETTTKILSRNLSICLTSNDQDECLRILKTVGKESNILYAVVKGYDGKVFSSYSVQEEFISPSRFAFKEQEYEFHIEDNFIITSYPIMDENERVGRIYLLGEFNISKVFAVKHSLVFLIIFAGSLILALFFSDHLQKKVSSQAGLILSAISKIKLEKKYNLRIENEKDWGEVDIEEFREIATSFDNLIEEIELKDFTLKLHNDNLEKIIEEKVSENLRSAQLASLGEMAGGIAHEINNPLTIIASTNRVLLMLLAKDKFDKDQFIQFVKNSESTVNRISRIVTGLRNMSRRSDDNDIAVVSFNDVFNDVSEVAEAKFKSKGIEIRKKYSEESATFLFRANRIQLCQVLVNLLNNSYDALVDLKGHELWVEIDITLLNGKVLLRITDAGSGIPLDVRKKMFNPFFTTKAIGKGTGIGLPLCKTMVEKMGGQFFYDEKSEHTSFIIQLDYHQIQVAG